MKQRPLFWVCVRKSESFTTNSYFLMRKKITVQKKTQQTSELRPHTDTGHHQVAPFNDKLFLPFSDPPASDSLTSSHASQPQVRPSLLQLNRNSRVKNHRDEVGVNPGCYSALAVTRVRLRPWPGHGRSMVLSEERLVREVWSAGSSFSRKVKGFQHHITVEERIMGRQVWISSHQHFSLFLR